MNKLQKVLLTIGFFLLLAIILKLIFWGSFTQTVHDFYFHFANASGTTLQEKILLNEGHHPNGVFAVYPPLWNLISYPFALSKEIYYLFTLIFFAFVPVVLLWFKTKSSYSAWFYFTASAFFWHLDYFATFAQYLAVIILMIAILRKDTLTRLILIPLAYLSHNSGLALLLLYYLVDYGVPLLKKVLLKAKEKTLPLFYPIINNKMGQIIPGLAINSSGAVLLFIFFEYHILYIILSLGGLVKEKTLFIFCFLLLFLGAFELRIWWVFSYIALIGLINYFELSNTRTRNLILAFSLFTLGIQLYCFSVLNIRPL